MFENVTMSKKTSESLRNQYPDATIKGMTMVKDGEAYLFSDPDLEPFGPYEIIDQ